MKGFKFFTILLIFLVFSVLLQPIWRVLHRRSNIPESFHTSSLQHREEKISAPIIATLHAILLLHATPPPLHCSISQNETCLLTESNAIASGEYRADVEIAKGKNLFVRAEWQDEEPHTFRVEVLVQGYQTPLEKAFWAQQLLEDTFPIPSSFLP